MHEQEAAEGQVDRFGQEQVLAGLGDGEHLAERGRRRGDLVTGARIAVDGVDASFVAHDLGEGHRHVPTTGADVDAAPPRRHGETLEGRGQGAPIDVVAQGVRHGPRRYWL